MKKILPPIIIILILSGLIFAFFQMEDVRRAGLKMLNLPQDEEDEITVNSFDACVLANYPVQESYPRRCTLPDGTVFTEEVKTLSYDIILETPRPNSTVSQNFEIEGEAVGPWFFEAQFTAELVDSEGEVVATAILTADGEWMTEDLVAFSGEMDAGGFSGNGELVLKSANPSGLPANQKSFSIPLSVN